jgi:hypothetical protein
MKFIISTLSPKMFLESDFDLRWHTLTEEEFQALILDAYSCVGYEDVALMLNVAHNKEPVKARAGDILLLADLSNGNLEYYCIQVCPSETPLVRAEELEYLEEEMI